MFKTVSGKSISRIAQGTWKMGESAEFKLSEIESLQAGISAGLNIIDTAEMYGDGRAELLIGEAINGFKRDNLFIVSKVYPWNSSKNKIFDACKKSIERMNSDYIDLYLLHWPGTIPLEETIAAMEDLQRNNLIKAWGVSNFSYERLKAMLNNYKNAAHCATNQVLYNLGDRGVEFDLYKYMLSIEMPLMAYCPLAKGEAYNRKIYESRQLKEMAAKHAMTVEALLIAFLLTKEKVIPIVKSARLQHLKENIKALDLQLSNEESKLLDKHFPAPTSKQALTVI